MDKKAVVYIFYDNNTDKFLVENRTKDQFLAGEKLFPAGKVETDELDNLDKTVIREAKEELGVNITEYKDLRSPVVGIGEFILYPYLITSWEGQIPERVLDKGSALEWVGRYHFKPKLKPVQELLEIANIFIKKQIVSYNIDRVLPSV